MKKFVLIFVTFALVGSVQCLAQNSSSTDQMTATGDIAKISWNVDEHDFGNVSQGTPVSFNFEFTNTSEKPLVITNVKASCGCTATNYPKEPVQPGETASITATYNAKAMGNFNKTITVYTNTDQSVKILKIKGIVE